MIRPIHRISIHPELSKRIAIEKYGNSPLQFGTNLLVWTPLYISCLFRCLKTDPDLDLCFLFVFFSLHGWPRALDPDKYHSIIEENPFMRKYQPLYVQSQLPTASPTTPKQLQFPDGASTTGWHRQHGLGPPPDGFHPDDTIMVENSEH